MNEWMNQWMDRGMIKTMAFPWGKAKFQFQFQFSVFKQKKFYRFKFLCFFLKLYFFWIFVCIYFFGFYLCRNTFVLFLKLSDYFKVTMVSTEQWRGGRAQKLLYCPQYLEVCPPLLQGDLWEVTIVILLWQIEKCLNRTNEKSYTRVYIGRFDYLP